MAALAPYTDVTEVRDYEEQYRRPWRRADGRDVGYGRSPPCPWWSLSRALETMLVPSLSTISSLYASCSRSKSSMRVPHVPLLFVIE
jgi:hypothetical protein